MQDAIVQLCCCANHCHSRQCFIKAAVVSCTFNFLEEREREYVGCMISYDPMFGQWPVCLLDVILWIHLEHFLQVTWRSCYSVSGTSWKLLEEDVTTTYQERLASYLKKTLQRIGNVLQVTWQICYNVPGTLCKLLEEDVTTYQERLASYLTKMLQRIRNVLQVTWRRCYNVSGTS